MVDEELAKESFEELYGVKPRYRFYVEYGRLKEYNAQIIKYYSNIKFKMSRRWMNVSPMIKKGLFESLFIRLFRRSKYLKPKKTMSLELYNNFIKNLDLSSKVKKLDPKLLESFRRVNDVYFNNSLDCPNLRFGREAYYKLASYNFHNDTVTVSSIFKNAPEELLDLLMYHELLHKKLKFSGTISKRFHTKKFRDLERQFKDYNNAEKRLNIYVRRMFKNRKL